MNREQVDSVPSRHVRSRSSGGICSLLGILFLISPLINCGGDKPSSDPSVQPDRSPTISSIAPSRVQAGANTFSLIVNGRNFASGARVRLNGEERSTTYVSSQQVKADITTMDIAMAGKARILVANPFPNPGFSNEVTLTVDNPVPILILCNPNSATAGSNPTTVILYGENFVSNSAVQFGTSSRAGKFINSTRLSIDLTAGDLANARSAAIRITNPAPGGGSSNAVTFNVTSPGLTVLTRNLPPSSPGKRYDYALKAGGGIPPYSWELISGALPGGLILDSDGAISGIHSGETSETHFGFTVKLTDSVSSSTSQLLDIAARSNRLGRNDICGTNATGPISNGVIRASISPYGDVDVYSLQVGAGARVSAEIRAQRLSLYGDPLSTDIFLDSFLEVLNSDCNRIAFNDDIEQGIVQDSSISSLYLPTAGVYYIRVSDLRGDGRPDFIYELQVSGAE